MSPLKRDWATITRHWPIILLLAGTGVAAFNTLAYMGLRHTVAINAFLMQTMMPVFIVILSFGLFRVPINKGQIGGVMLCLIGAITIIVQGDVRVMASLSFNPGDLLVLTAVLSYAGYSVLLRKRPPIHPLSFVGVTFILGALMLLPLYLWETFAVRAIQFNRVTLLAVAYVGIFPVHHFLSLLQSRGGTHRRQPGRIIPLPDAYFRQRHGVFFSGRIVPLVSLGRHGSDCRRDCHNLAGRQIRPIEMTDKNVRFPKGRKRRSRGFLRGTGLRRGTTCGILAWLASLRVRRGGLSNESPVW
jgi:hypothetical protein